MFAALIFGRAGFTVLRAVVTTTLEYCTEGSGWGKKM